MRDKRQKILADPERYRKEQIEDRLPDDFDDLPEDEQMQIEAALEGMVASIDPFALREEIQRLGKLIEHARALEEREIESKLVKLRKVLSDNNIFNDPKMKLLIFTEHKDTLDYLAGDGKDGRPFGRLRQWNLKTTQIHGGMKIGDRDTLGSRIYAEREFREDAQVLAATEAAGEGINLQFCWFMVNYDIPWNPVRLEQRMGRIHRYGQEHDCLIFNFVAVNTREGRVLAKLLERLLAIRRELGTDQVFDVVGEVFPANLLEKLFREMYLRRLDLSNIEARIVRDVDPERFRRITSSTLEGLAKRELNLGALLGKSAEARERRLVPEVIEGFFVAAGPIAGIHPKPVQKDGHVYRVGKVPRMLQPIGERLEPRFGRLGREYQKVVFDKALLPTDPTLEWVTPGHPLFEAVRDDVAERVRDDLKRGAVFYDLQAKAPVRLDAFGASVKDGRGNTVSRRLFIVQADEASTLTLRQPTYLAALAFAPVGTPVPNDAGMPDRARVEQALVEKALNPFLEEIAAQRASEVETIARHLEISLGELIHRANMSLADLANRRVEGQNIPGLEGNIAQAEAHLDELNNRLEGRRAELAMERHLAIGDIEHLGCAWVLPHPQRTSPGIAPMVRDEEIERIAVQEAIRHETERGWVVEGVEKDNRGFDLISRKPHPHDAKTFTDVRFIEVKGRVAIGEIAVGSALWGLAAQHVGVSIALASSAAASILGLVAILRWPLREITMLDLTPSAHWAEPHLDVVPAPDDGPVRVEVEYRVDPLQTDAFVEAIRDLEPIRRRDGAVAWAVYQDPGRNGRYVESFIVESWLEHLRQHERATVGDRTVQERIRRFHSPARRLTSLIWSPRNLGDCDTLTVGGGTAADQATSTPVRSVGAPSPVTP
jgi:hypothetical protein